MTRGFILLVILMALGATCVQSEDALLPANVFTAILLKAQNYDRNVARLGQDKIVIGIAYMAGDPQGEGFAAQVNGDIDQARNTFKLKGKAIESDVIILEKVFDRKDFEDQLAKNHVSILVIINNVPFIKDLLEVTKSLQINSVGNDPQCLKQGVALGIIQRDNKPRMLINLPSMKAEGSDYSANFLSLCEQVQ